MRLFSWVHWAICLWREEEARTASTGCPLSRGTTSAIWPEDPRTPLCSWGFTLLTRAPPGRELRSCSLCVPLVYSLNGIETLSFRLSPFHSPCGCFQFSTFSPAAFGEGCFCRILLPTVSVFSPHAKAAPCLALPSAASLSPSSPLHTVYLQNSVLQVVQIVVLILRSEF